MAILAGAGNGSAGIVLQDATASSIGGGTRIATWRINTDGYVYIGDNAVYTQQYQWKQNGAASSAYEVRADLVYGSVSGTTGSWLGLGTTRDWSVLDSTADGNTDEGMMIVQIRDASSLAVIATAEVTFYTDRQY